MRIPVLAILIAAAFASGSAFAALAPDDWYFKQGYSRMPAHFLKSGMGMTEGMMDARDFYLSGDAGSATIRNSAARYGSLQQVISLQGWRGRRVSLSLRLKNDGDARAWATVQITERGHITIAAPQQNDSVSGQWETRRFVLDVPRNAEGMILNVGLTDRGTVWLDGMKLETVGPNIAVSESYRKDMPQCCGGEWGLGNTASNAGGYISEPIANTRFPSSDGTQYGH